MRMDVTPPCHRPLICMCMHTLCPHVTKKAMNACLCSLERAARIDMRPPCHHALTHMYTRAVTHTRYMYLYIYMFLYTHRYDTALMSPVTYE